VSTTEELLGRKSFAKKRRSLGRYSSLADFGEKVAAPVYKIEIMAIGDLQH
jgi:hypothetical protein